MATFKPSSPTSDPVQTGRRRLWRSLAWAAVVLAGGAVIFVSLVWRPAVAGARMEAAQAARIACSCRYVGGRALGDCGKAMPEGDMPKGRFPVTLSEDTAARSVTARVPLASAQTATYREGWGCQLAPWGE